MSGKQTYIIAASALIIMLVIVIANALYIKSTADHILSLIDVSYSDTDTLLTISEHWNGCLPLLRLSLSQKELDDISVIINEAIIYAERSDMKEYKRSMANLRRAIESIKKREEVSLENIF